MITPIRSDERHFATLDIFSIHVSALVRHVVVEMSEYFFQQFASQRIDVRKKLPAIANRLNGTPPRSNLRLPDISRRRDRTSLRGNISSRAVLITILSVSTFHVSDAVAQSGPAGTLGVQMQVSDAQTSETTTSSGSLAPAGGSCTLSAPISGNFGTTSLTNGRLSSTLTLDYSFQLPGRPARIGVSCNYSPNVTTSFYLSFQSDNPPSGSDFQMKYQGTLSGGNPATYLKYQLLKNDSVTKYSIAPMGTDIQRDANAGVCLGGGGVGFCSIGLVLKVASGQQAVDGVYRDTLSMIVTY